jgi:hypothetical protein
MPDPDKPALLADLLGDPDLALGVAVAYQLQILAGMAGRMSAAAGAGDRGRVGVWGLALAGAAEALGRELREQLREAGLAGPPAQAPPAAQSTIH